MKKKITSLFVIILFLAGLSLLLYPFISNEWNNYRQSKLITAYDETVAEMEASGRVDYQAEWERAHAYNDALVPYILPDSFAAAEVPEDGNEKYLACLNLAGDGMMGYVQIPKINVKLPIYHTTSEEVLQKAAGHLAGSSLPVGGEGTHAVISAHRGLPSAALFTDLDRLEEGDYFLLHILDETLCYEIDKISVVEPTDTSALEAEEGRDLVTLLTCTPYGVNSHRLLVQGHRTVFEEFEEEEIHSLYAGPSVHTNYLFWVLAGLAVTGLFILVLFLYDRGWKKRHGGNTPRRIRQTKAGRRSDGSGGEGKQSGRKDAGKTGRPKKESGKKAEGDV